MASIRGSEPTAGAFAPPDIEFAFLAGDGEMAALLRGFDWRGSRLGMPASWPSSLRTVVRMMLTTRHPVFIFWGPEHLCLYNDAYRETLDATRHPAMLGQTGADAWPDIWQTIGPQIDFVLEGRGATWHENQPLSLLRDGRPVETWWTYSYGPIDEAAAPHGVGGVLVLCSETTQQMRDARRLHFERERLSTLFEQAPSFMALLRGPEHCFELANPRYRELVGHRELIGRTALDAMPELRAQGYIDLLDQVYRTGVPFSAFGAHLAPADAPAQSPPGASRAGDPMRDRYLDFVFQPLTDVAGAVEGVFVQGVDVTERWRAERALGRSEERFRLAAESTGLGTFDIGLDDGQVQLSESARAVLGLPGTAPKLAELLDRVHPEDRPTLERALEDARRGLGGGYYRTLVRIVATPNDVRHVSVSGRVSHDGDGPDAPRRTAGILWDATEHHTLVEALQRADRLKDEFLATLAHELRNPLAALRSASYLMTREGVTPERQRWCGEVIQRQSKAMALLLDDLMEVSRITRGKVELKPERVELRAVIDAALETARPVIDARSHTLELELPEAPVHLEADPLRLAQVLVNLLSNAARYTDHGGTLRLTARATAGELRIEVADNGVGIAPEAMPTLFEMFHRDTPASRGSGGLGVGLAVSKGLVALHGGRLEATSPGPGLGATFHVVLPLPQHATSLAGAAGTTAVPGLDGAPSHGTRVLVADDNADAAEAIAVLLRLDGYAVEVVHDGRKAFEAARGQPPFAAFFDIGMPGMDGYQLATEIRRQPWGKRMYLIAMTGWGQGADKDRAYAAGFDLHLTKPVDLDSITALLEKRRESFESSFSSHLD